MAKLAFLACSSSTTAHLNLLVSSYTPTRSLCSGGGNNLLIVLHSKLVIGTHAFRSSAPTVFNSLPPEHQSCDHYADILKHTFLTSPSTAQSLVPTSPVQVASHSAEAVILSIRKFLVQAECLPSDF